MDIYCDCEVPAPENTVYVTKAHGETENHYKKVVKCGLCLRQIKKETDD